MSFPKMRLYTFNNQEQLTKIRTVYVGEIFAKKSKVDGRFYVYCELKKFNQITDRLKIHLEPSFINYLKI